MARDEFMETKRNEILEKLKVSEFNTLGTLVQLSLDNNAVLNTILVVLQMMHNDGKSEEQKTAINEKINDALRDFETAALDSIVGMRPIQKNKQ